jgi:zinc transporter, ZIP family
LISALLFGLAASSALLIGAALGSVWDPPKALTGVLLAFASGALISALAFELFEEAHRLGGAARSGFALLAGAALLAAGVVAGRALAEPLSDEVLSVALGFAGGAVLASLADTLTPEAFELGGPLVAFATAVGFLLSFILAV